MKRRRMGVQTMMRLWSTLPSEYQSRMFSYAWSASLHGFGIVILLLCIIPIESKEPFTFALILSEASNDAEFAFEAIEIETMPLEAIEESLSPHTSMEMSAISPSVVEPTLLASSMSNHSLAAQHQEVDQNDSRVLEVTRRVKAAGGSVLGAVRVSLSWDTIDDLDLHVQYRSTQSATRNRSFAEAGYLFFGQPATPHARLDVDANARTIVPAPCENVIFAAVPKKAKIAVGLHLFSSRSGKVNVPFTITVHHGTKLELIEGTVSVKDEVKQVFAFTYP